MRLEVSSSESLSLMITGDSTSLFRKAYRSLEGGGFSSIGGRVDFQTLEVQELHQNLPLPG
jgi:hypothetical protein